MNSYSTNLSFKIEEYVRNNLFQLNSLGLLRSFIALSLIINVAFNAESIIFPRINDLPISSHVSLLNFFTLSNYLGINFSITKIIAILLLAWVIYGSNQIITSILHFWIAFSYLKFATFIDGGDQVCANVTLLLIPIILFDKRKNHWTDYKSDFVKSYHLILIVFLFILRTQISVIYLHAFIGKLNVAEWTNGTAMYYWATNSFFGMSDRVVSFIFPVLTNAYFITIFTYSILLLELTLALQLFNYNRKYLKILFYFGLLFHMGIIIVHGIFTFSISMIGLLTQYCFINILKHEK